METYRPDRVVRGLSIIVSIAYYGLWVGAVLILAGTVVLKLSVGGDPDWVWGVPVQAAVADADASFRTSWGTGHIQVQDVRASLELPISMVPWWLFALLWVHMAAGCALLLPALRHLRRIFRRVRDGAPFDAENAVRLRTVGLLLLALALLNGVAEFVTSQVVRGGLESAAITVRSGVHVDGSLVIFGLVLMALAEIFRRGAQLEHEQSLVI